MQISYDDRKLEEFFAELEPKKRKSALKGAMRRSAGRVKKRAARNLKTGSGKRLRNAEAIAKGIRAIVYKKRAVGFRVTIGTKRVMKGTKRYERMRKAIQSGRSYDKDGFHLNRRGEVKPILLWAEGGTVSRKTKTGSSWRGSTRKRRGHPTGRMPAYYYMKRTLSQTRDTVTEDVRTDIRETMTRLVKRYGSS